MAVKNVLQGTPAAAAPKVETAYSTIEEITVPVADFVHLVKLIETARDSLPRGSDAAHSNLRAALDFAKAWERPAGSSSPQMRSTPDRTAGERSDEVDAVLDGTKHLLVLLQWIEQARLFVESIHFWEQRSPEFAKLTKRYEFSPPEAWEGPERNAMVWLLGAHWDATNSVQAGGSHV